MQIFKVSMNCLLKEPSGLLRYIEKNSLFFSSEESVETALAFFTLIETCKNVGLNVRDYIATTIKLLMDGNKNYDDLVPMSVAI